MYGEEVRKRALEALDEGASAAEAALLVGVCRKTVCRWKAKRRALAGQCATIDQAHPNKKEIAMTSADDLYKPPRSGPLSGLSSDQIENLLLRAVLADLKAGGWSPDSTSNKSKCELGERLRLASGLPLRLITAFLKISKSSYEYHRARLGQDKYAKLRREIRELFEQSGATFGYRRVWAHLRRRGRRVSEKVVRRLMREEGLFVVKPNRPKKYCAYKGELTDAPPNLVRRRFHADEPDNLWLTDLTEFHLAGGEKVYLNAVIDCFDGAPISWATGPRPTKELANESLAAAVGRMRKGARPIIHSDRGVHYRTPTWIKICDDAGVTRSMSRKGCCGDNAACEGFFGRLKIEFFYGRDWRGVGACDFMKRLDDYLRYYRNGRIKQSLAWLSPAEYRQKLGYGF